jgi:hypothetical protein
MNQSIWRVALTLSGMVLITAPFTSSQAQTAEVKEKPPMYMYESFWAYPRANWGDVDKEYAATDKVMQKALADGRLVGYGSDATLVHDAEGATHDEWFQGQSLGAVLGVLDEIYKTGAATSKLFLSATKHMDAVFVARYYNWRPGSWKGAYTLWSEYALKPDAPQDAVDVIAKSFVVPLMEKLLKDGAIVEYEIDTQALHTSAPGMFAISYITSTPDGLDKARAGLMEALGKNPLAGSSFASFVDMSKHRDALVRTTATYK